MENNVFSVKDLSFSYGKNSVIENINFKIEEGKITTLIGANGCGKSTLFHLMTRSLRPEKGEILLGDENISGMKLKEFAKKVAIVHQYNTAPEDLSVEKLVSYGRIPHQRIGKRGDVRAEKEKIRWAMEITDTWKYKDKLVSSLSGGQKQRVWIALALAQDTKILFLDEPTTYLDIRYQIQILKLIKKLNREYNITIIMVLHDINQSIYYSDRMIAMKEGKIIATGCPEKIIDPKLIKTIYGVELEQVHFDHRSFVIPV